MTGCLASQRLHIRHRARLRDRGRLEVRASSTRDDISWEALSVTIPPDVMARRLVEHRQVRPEMIFGDCRVPSEVPGLDGTTPFLGASPER
jgi:hypothetical protein